MSLRRQIVRGGAFLAVRQGAGIVISVVGVLLLTRQIGPEGYGLYAAALGVSTYVQSIALCGINVYLVRRTGDDTREVYDQASTLLLALGVVTALVAAALTPWLATWMRLPGFAPLARTMFVALPVVLIGQAALARLERRLDFRRVAVLELGAQLAYFAVALPLAFAGFGAWAPAIAWLVQQALLSGALLASAGYWPRIHWDRSLAREMTSYGISLSSSMWAWNLRTLVNPLVVGRFAGADAVGTVALAIRLVEYLSFVKTATWRLSIAALARLQDDRQRLRRAVSEGIRLQAIALGPLLVGFGWIAPWAIPRLFGAEWLPVVSVYPFIALAYLFNAVFSLHSSALYVLRRNWAVATFHIVHVALFAGTALLLVPTLGVIGYGVAELVALASYALLHSRLTAAVGEPRYGAAVVWTLVFGAALFYRYAWWTSLGLVLVALLPSSRVELQSVRKELQRV